MPAAAIAATILSIGDELLIGQTVNTNAAWMGARLNAAGIRVERALSIGDDRPAILETLRECRTAITLITGGLGPTKDDITKEVLCEFFNTRLVRHKAIEERIEALFRSLGRDPLEMNRAQADLPENCTPIPNTRGTASGMWFERDDRVFVSMPGVPYEMQEMMEHHVLPRLVDRFKPPAIIHRTILTTGLGESHLAARIADWESGLAAGGIKLAYLPSPGIVKLRLSIYDQADAATARERIDACVERLRALVPELIYGEGEERIEQVVGRLLHDRKEPMAVAESCTGGAIMKRITSVPGSSAWFAGGVVSYADAAKRTMLGVSGSAIDAHGAVSREVVEAMAHGARERFGVHWSIATSGVAGPDGGTAVTPVGTVWIAVDGPDGLRSSLQHIPGTRDLVIERASVAALNLLRLHLIGRR